jgi:hypothetical protein
MPQELPDRACVAARSRARPYRPLSFTFGLAPAQTAPTAGTSGFTFAYDLTNRRIGGTATDNSLEPRPLLEPCPLLEASPLSLEVPEASNDTPGLHIGSCSCEFVKHGRAVRYSK